MASAELTKMPLLGLVPGALPAEVLAIVSHDLRTPLGVISMATRLLGDESQPPDQRHETLKVIGRAADYMERLIHDILETARLDAGCGLMVRRSPTHLHPLLVQASELLAALTRNKSQTLECQSPVELPKVLADPDRVFQVVSNLVTNASKFTLRGGRICISARREGADVRVSVADSGPGILDEEIPRVFDPYWQAQRTASLGYGLGLKIARAIVEAHGGRIQVDSSSEGSTFSFTLPVANGNRS